MIAPSAAPGRGRGHLVARRLFGIRRGTARSTGVAACMAGYRRGHAQWTAGGAPWLTSSSTGESGAFLPRSAYPASTRCTKQTPTRAETVDGVAEAADSRGATYLQPPPIPQLLPSYTTPEWRVYRRPIVFPWRWPARPRAALLGEIGLCTTADRISSHARPRSSQRIARYTTSSSSRSLPFGAGW